MEQLISWNKHPSDDEVKRLHLQFGNDGFVQLLSMLGFVRTFRRAEGMHLWDEAGNQYLDFLGGAGCLNLGHNPPAVIAALREALATPVCNIMQGSLGEYPAILAHNLIELAPGNLRRVGFTNSGTECVEVALKMARAATGKRRILSVDRGFHGKTYGALSALGNPEYQEPFLPLVPGFKRVPRGDLDALERELSEGDVAAFIVEPILGEGGVLPHPPNYLKRARELCRRQNSLFIADEVQTGMGRTGKLFCVEHDGLDPDIICLAKSLSGSMIPIGATLATDEVWQGAFGGHENATRHVTTFGGNALACIAGIAALETIVNSGLMHQAVEKGERLTSGLLRLKQKHKSIKEVRGRGLMVGVEFGALAEESEDLGLMVSAILLNKYKIIAFGTLNNLNVIRLQPPLIVSNEQIDLLLAALADALVSLDPV
jgi:putrescine aminotransferase